MQIEEEADDARKVNSTYGVSNIVRVGNRITSVPNAFVVGVKIIKDDNINVSTKKPETGQKIEMVRGSFSGLVTKLTQVNSANLLKFFFDLVTGKVRA